MADDDDVLIACTCVILASCATCAAVSTILFSNNKRRHKTWIRKYIGKRGQLGTFNTLLPDLCFEVKLCDYLRIDLTTFEELYALIEPEVTDTKVCWSGHVEISICMSQTKPIELVKNLSNQSRHVEIDLSCQ